jgi:hypothetical protein
VPRSGERFPGGNFSPALRRRDYEQQGSDPVGHVEQGQLGQPVSASVTVQPLLAVMWQELFAPTQHDWLQDLPATVWQQWPERQSLF